MEKIIIKGTVTKKEQLKNSIYGGPRERVYIKSVTGGDLEAKTASNSSAGYMLSFSMEHLKDRVLEFECHLTRSHLLVIDRIISGYFGA